MNVSKRKRVRVQLNTGEGLTEQAHKKQCDMNYILRSYAKTGLIQHAHKNEGRYDDVSAIDFQTAQNIVADAKSMFEALPSLTRREFDNDVSKFLKFVRNPENGEKMQEMGITPGVDGIDANGELIASMQQLIKAIKPAEDDGDQPSPEVGGKPSGAAEA